MTPATDPMRLFRFLRSRPAVKQDDAADMGTAFGLEMSLDQSEFDDEPKAQVGAPTRGWLSRLIGRRAGPRP